MLVDLHIRDIGVISEVDLELAPGLNVLTGETGAGKTMVVAALELLLGARADSDRVRADATKALVEGRFAPAPANAADWLGEGDDELVVARELGGGRSRARLGGRLAPASALAEVVGDLVEVHGQSESARLAVPATQRALLDRGGGADLAEALDGYQEAYRRWRAAAAELEELVEGERDRARELDRLAFELAEIDAVDPQPDEEEALAAELSRLEHAEALIGAAQAAGAALTDDGGARDLLGAAVAALRAVEGIDEELGALQARTEGLAAESQDLGLELSRYADGLELDPARLDELRDRLGRLTALCRKYGPDAKAVVAYAEQAREQLARLRGGDERAQALSGEVADLERAVTAAAERLRTQRRRSADALVAATEGHLAELAMPQARMEVALEPVQPGPDGAERVTFLLSANPGQPALPLAKAASGGERSRVALAVRLALADADETPTFVFDEVDAGVGGAVALAVGEKLARLARGRQVLCVTHLAQLAAYADTHFVVAKQAQDGAAVATVSSLEQPERVSELARMLSGATASTAAAEHAAELLADATAAKSRP